MENNTPLLEVKDLHVSIGDTEILKGVDLTVRRGETHAIMGPNGSGKSTLANVLAGRPEYEVTRGTVLYKGQDLLAMDPETRAREGLFLAFQYPVELPGVRTWQFLKSALDAIRQHHGLEETSVREFDRLLEDKLRAMNMSPEFVKRSVNEGFSGGEKKRHEILQLLLLEPTLALLDETDSGLDIDALKVVAQGINRFRVPEKAVVLVTHYQRILNYLEPDRVFIMKSGKIVKRGGKELVDRLEKEGYKEL